MKKLLIALALFSTSAIADDVIRIGTGPKGLSYAEMGQQLVNKLPSDIKVELVPTKGGMDNVICVAGNSDVKCDYGIAPLPMILETTGVTDVGSFDDSYTMLVCSKQVVKDKDDLSDLPEKTVIAIGVAGSTANWTWKKLVAEKSRLSKFTAIEVPFGKAISNVIDGKIGCAFTASGLSAPLLAGIDNAERFVTIMNMDMFGMMSTPKGFESFKLDGKQYPNLLKGWFHTIKVLKFRTVLFTRPMITIENPMVHGIITQMLAK